jgi:hypothetical protein
MTFQNQKVLLSTPFPPIYLFAHHPPPPTPKKDPLPPPHHPHSQAPQPQEVAAARPCVCEGMLAIGGAAWLGGEGCDVGLLLPMSRIAGAGVVLMSAVAFVVFVGCDYSQ